MAETPITPNSLPTESGELIYGPDLIPLPSPPKDDFSSYINNYESSPTSNADPFSNVNREFEQTFYKNAQKMDYLKMGAPTPFNAESSLFDKFASSWDFEDKGFIPWRDNDEIYNEDTNLLKELYRSTKWAAPLFGEGFVSGIRTLPDLVGGAYNWDWDQIIKSDDYLAEKWSRATKMGGSTAGGVSSFLTNFEISAANMLGMITETVIEDAVIGAMTVYSGGATAPLAAVAAGKTASVFSSIYKGLKNINKVTDVFKEANNARRFWEITANGAKAFGVKTVKNVGNFLNPIQQSGKFLNDLRKGEQYIKDGSAFGNTVQGFGSFYRDIREINFALTEAKLEGGFSYLERSEQMTNDYIAKNGYAPQGEDAQDIEANARAGGDFTTQANLPVIYFSNRFGFGNLFKGYTPLNKLMREAESGSSVFKNITFNNAKKLFEETKDFSVKRAFKQGIGSSLNYFKANYMEGIQENLQDVIQGAATDYYDKQFKTPSYGGYMVMMGDIGEQFGKKVFTGQGAETFASGALMGLVVQGGIRAKSGIQNLTYRVGNNKDYKEFKAKRTEQIDKYVTKLNEMYQDPSKYLDPQLMNAVRQGELSKYLSQSVKNKNKKEFYDIKDQAVYEHLWTMARSGKSEIFKDRLEEMKQLAPEEFENALGFNVENPAEFKSYIDDQIKKVDQIQNLYDKAESKLINPVNLSAFKKGTKEYYNAANQFLAFENAKQQAVFANYSFMRNAERMQGLLSDMNKNKLFTKSTSYLDFSLLTDPSRLEGEMTMLKRELDSLSQVEGDAATKKLIKDKKDRLASLEIWNGTMNSPQLSGDVDVAIEKQSQLPPIPGRPQTDDIKGPTIPLYPVDYPSIDNSNYDNWRRAAKLAFERLVETEATINKDSVYRESINDVFDLIVDYHTLGRESEGMLEMVNILADPNNFLKLYEGHFSVIKELNRKKIEALRESVIKALTINDENALANLLGSNNYVEDISNPGTYFRLSDLTPIEPDSEDAKKIKEIIADYEAATSKEEEKSEETPLDPEEETIVSDVTIGMTPEEDIYLIEYDGVNYEVFVEEPTQYFTENPDGTTNAIKNADVPDIVKSELDKYIKAKTPPAPPAAPPSAPVVSILPDLLDRLEDITDLIDLDPLQNYFDDKKKEYKQLNDVERETFAKAFNKKYAVLSGEADLDENDPKWKAEYNTAINNVKALVKKPGLTEQDVKDIFNKAFIPVISKLKDKAAKAKYRAEMKEERDNIILAIQNNEKARNVNALKIIINDIFKNNILLSDIENAAVTVFTNIVSPDVKEQIIEHFTQQLDKKIQAEISKLEEAIGSSENDAIVKKYIDYVNIYKQKIEVSLEGFKKEAEDIKEKTAGITLAVDVDENYENDDHTSILSIDAFERIKATGAQNAALNNLVTSGILLANEIENVSSIHDASEIINLGVARIFTVGINKGIYIYLKTGKIDFLQKELSDYLQRGKGDKTNEDITAEVKDKIESIKLGEQEVGAILTLLDIPETAEIGDEVFKLLKEFRFSVYNVQTETQLLESIVNLQEKQNRFISSGVIPSTIEELLDEKDIKIIEKYLAGKKKGTKLDVTPFYEDLLEVIEKIQSATDVKEADKFVTELVKKHIAPAKKAEAKSLVNTFIGNVLETQALLSGEIEVGAELSDEEIIKILNGEKRSLTPSQIKQVKAYEKDLIELYRKKFSAAPGYSEMLIDYDKELLDVTKDARFPNRLKYLALRQKDAADVRTLEELMSEYKATDGKLNIRTSLQIIIDSEYATDGEKELARTLLNTIGADETMDIDNTMEDAGGFSADTERIAINMSAVGYKDNYPSNPIETVILHELLHGKIERALQDPNSDYTKSMKSLYAAVKQNPNASSFYAYQPGMDEDEQLREFVIEAFTNPGFQYLLASIPYAKSGKSTWQKFLDILSNLLKSIGIDVEGTALNEVINQTTELIKFDFTEKMLKRLTEVKTSEEIEALREEINKEGSVLSPNISESILSALDAKSDSILAQQVTEAVKSMTKVKLNGRTYYFKMLDGDIKLYIRTNKKLIQVRQPAVIDAFIKSKSQDGSLERMIGKNNFAALNDLMGDPQKRGSYASGEMDDIPIDEGRLKNAVDAPVVIKFNDITQFNEFRKEYLEILTTKTSKTLVDLRAKYPGTGINSYIEIFNGLGGVNTKKKGKSIISLTDKKIDRLIKEGVLKINIKGITHEDFINDDENETSLDDFIEMYEMILAGADMGLSDKGTTRLNINKVIGDIFGVKSVSQETQDIIENIVRKNYNLEEDLSDDEDVLELDMEDEKEEGFFAGSTEPVPGKEDTPSDFEPSTTDPSDTITAVNPNALRSHPYDVFRNGNETPFFTEFYNKVRTIINALSLKPLSDLQEVYVTLDKDNAGLRWDGSGQSNGWITAPKGIVGYLSDKQGNPLIMSADGTIVGKLDKANLSDKKGLDDGVNQIVYFTTFTETSNTDASKLLTPETKEKLLAARARVNQGFPQIAKIVTINQGEMNKKSLTKSSAAKQANTKNADFYNQISQPNVTFKFNTEGDLLAVITAEDGGTNEFGIFPPKTKNVQWTNDGKITSLFNHLINVMVVYHQMKLRGDNVTELQNELALFVRNMWLTGENFNLQIPKNFERIRIKDKKSSLLIPKQILNIRNGQIVLNTENIDAARTFMENIQINVSKDWLSGKIKFKYPRIITKNGINVLKFEERDYKDFMFKEIGLSSNVTEIPTIENIKRYNSTIEFTDPTNLIESTTPSITITEEQLLDNQNIVKEQVDDAIKNSENNTTEDKNEVEALKKKKKFRAPSYDQIFEKTC